MHGLRYWKELIGEVSLKSASLIDQDDLLLDHMSHFSEGSMTVDQSFTKVSPLDDPDGYVIFPIIKGGEGVGSNPYHMCIFAHAFRARGYEPLLPICASDLDTCFQKPHNGRVDFYCAQCEYANRSLIEEFGLEPEPLEKYFEDDRKYSQYESNHEMYRGVPVDDLALASTRRSLTRRHIKQENHRHRLIYNGFLESALILTDAAHALFEEYDIAATVVSDPTYIYGGTFMHVAANRDIPAYSFGAGYSRGSLMFGNARNISPLQQFSEPSIVKSHIQQSLSDEERSQIDRILADRFSGKGLLKPIAEASKSVDTGEYQETIGLFTNLIWDASLEDMDTIFESEFGWIECTLEFLQENPQILLILKTHPAEKVYGTSQPVAEWIREHVSPLPENFRILEPDTEISPYQLLDELDVGIVYNSTIGLEMATQGIPVIVAGQTHYRGHGFTHDPESAVAYRELLDELDSLSISDSMRRRAKRYAHFLFVQKQFYLPELFSKFESSQFTYNDVSEEEIFDVIVNAIVADNPVVSSLRPPETTHKKFMA